ncbi:MAG: hypothetical protein EA379_06415 [Phycisphaerales bacterium]|nr:MAG: hypothetical protein EA379_06415 [Phycisphaerales bacterium]
MGAAGGAQALIVANEMQRPDNGFVGRWAGSSAVAVGEHWVLTAAHVGGSVGNNFRMQRRSFEATAMIRHHSADLILVRVAEALPGWHGITGDVSKRDRVVLAGVGHTAGAQVGKHGLDWTGELRAAWGENTIQNVQGDTLAMRYFAKGKKALPHEAAFAYRDSGGGVFLQGADGTLALAGVAVGASDFGRTMHGSMSYALSLGSYLDWIAEATNGEVDVLGAGRVDGVGYALPAPGGVATLAMLAVLGARRRRG